MQFKNIDVLLEKIDKKIENAKNNCERHLFFPLKSNFRLGRTASSSQILHVKKRNKYSILFEKELSNPSVSIFEIYNVANLLFNK